MHPRPSAGGKGVVVTNSAEAVHSWLRPILADDDRGRSGVFLFSFHAKGIWITAVDDDGDDGDDDDVDRLAPPPRRRHLDHRHHRPEIIGDQLLLLATVIGSSNFGSRSEKLDLESNCILIFNAESSMAAGGGGGVWIIGERVRGRRMERTV